MKIAYLIAALDAGGAERVTVELANAFARDGHDVTIFVGWPSGSERALASRPDPRVGVEYIEARERNRFLSYLAAARWAWRMRARLFAFDVVHCHLTYGAFIATLLDRWRPSEGRSRPLIVETYHAVGMRIPAAKRWAHAVMAVRRDVLVLMATDPYWTRFAEIHPRLTVRTILNGAPAPLPLSDLDDKARRGFREELGIPAGARLIVGSIGMLRPDRQPTLFVPIISRLRQEFGDDLHWIFSGDGPERPALEKAVADAGLASNVHLAGLVSDLRYPLSLMMLHFTLTVGSVSGLAAMEGAMAGVPVVGVQLVAGHSSAGDWIWSSSSGEAVAAAAADLLRDPAKLDALAERQQQYAVAHLSVDAMAKSYMEVYKESRCR